MKHFEDLISMVIKPIGNAPVYNCMLTINNESSGMHFSCAKGLTGDKGMPISANFRFRTGSITKLFTAAIIMQMKKEGCIGLDDLYFDLIEKETKIILSGVHVFEDTDYSKKISLRHLLQHQSGLRDYFSEDDRFLHYVIQHPSESWDWKRVMEKYFEFELNLKPSFAPGNGFHYSDTNYLLLAVLIEQITHKPLQQVYREKIITPLRLTDTYLEFYERPKQVKPVVYPYYGIHSLDNIDTSFDWGGGGLISTMNDLDIFIRALVKGNFYSQTESPELLMRPTNKNSVTQSSSQLLHPGLGFQRKDFPGYSFVGHSSAYGSMLYYEPEKDISIVLSLNQAAAVHKAEWLLRKIVREFPKEILQ